MFLVVGHLPLKQKVDRFNYGCLELHPFQLYSSAVTAPQVLSKLMLTVNTAV